MPLISVTIGGSVEVLGEVPENFPLDPDQVGRIVLKFICMPGVKDAILTYLQAHAFNEEEIQGLVVEATKIANTHKTGG